MNSSATSGLNLCPHENRRSIAELACKTFVVHFTTVVAFCHLLSIRGQWTFTWKLVYYTLAPWYIFVQHALALSLIAVTFLVNFFLPATKKISTRRALRWLFGTIQQKTPDSSTDNSSSWCISQSYANIGRVIVAAAFMTQCAGS